MLCTLFGIWCAIAPPTLETYGTGDNVVKKCVIYDDKGAYTSMWPAPDDGHCDVKDNPLRQIH